MNEDWLARLLEVDPEFLDSVVDRRTLVKIGFAALFGLVVTGCTDDQNEPVNARNLSIGQLNSTITAQYHELTMFPYTSTALQQTVVEIEKEEATSIPFLQTDTALLRETAEAPPVELQKALKNIYEIIRDNAFKLSLHAKKGNTDILGTGTPLTAFYRKNLNWLILATAKHVIKNKAVSNNLGGVTISQPLASNNSPYDIDNSNVIVIPHPDDNVDFALMAVAVAKNYPLPQSYPDYALNWPFTTQQTFQAIGFSDYQDENGKYHEVINVFNERNPDLRRVPNSPNIQIRNVTARVFPGNSGEGLYAVDLKARKAVLVAVGVLRSGSCSFGGECLYQIQYVPLPSDTRNMMVDLSQSIT